MRRKVVQTELEPREYSRVVAAARKKGLTIKEALRQAVRQWTLEESASDAIRRGMKKGVKLRDVWGSRTITHEDWLSARRILHESEEATRRKLVSHTR